MPSCPHALDYVIDNADSKAVDYAALGRIFSGWAVDVGSVTFPAPFLIVAGRNDAVVGYAEALELLGTYPSASLAVVEGAGHALMHERPELLAALLRDWLDSIHASTRASTSG